MLFQGEMMTCAICGAQQRSDPQVESQWTAVQLDGITYYVCTKHVNENTQDFKKAWLKILKQLIAKHRAG